MAGKTNTEAIRELERLVPIIGERAEVLRRDLDRLDAAHSKTVEGLNRAATQIAVLEREFAELKRATEESDRKRWLLTVGVIGVFLTLVANIVLSFFRK